MFNSLDIMENSSVLEELKFGEGDGNLHYYFYNFKCPEISPDRVRGCTEIRLGCSHKYYYSLCPVIHVLTSFTCRLE